MTNKKPIKSNHLFYEINKWSVFCWDCRGVRAKDSTLHSNREQKSLDKWDENVSHILD